MIDVESQKSSICELLLRGADLDVTLLDLRGLKCPLPALHTRRALARLPAGAHLRVLATDPMSVIDVPHAVAQASGRLISQSSADGVHSFEIERLATAP